eukprot:TRINITY_DN6845_c0_g1_i1.p1 TRINITY_DN6845_c0_g1~~TRINITY_DN6845_c0_g1_i1.p1  ORF type:complete len:268 (-),score=36.77 TRINITY_DN6845_c0_g1_i1:38-775(-)
MSKKLIDRLYFYQERWILLTRARKGIVGQTVISSPIKDSFPMDKLKSLIDEGKRINSICAGNGLWVIVADIVPDGKKIPHCIYVQKEFPEEDLSGAWKKGFRVTYLTHVRGIWIVVMVPQTPGAGGQGITYEDDIPKEDIKEAWEKDKRIHSLIWGSGIWALLTEKDLEDKPQKFSQNTILTRESVEEIYKQGKAIVSLGYDSIKNIWVLIAEPTSDPQTLFESKNLPEDEIGKLGIMIVNFENL